MSTIIFALVEDTTDHFISIFDALMLIISPLSKHMLTLINIVNSRICYYSQTNAE